jgi:hypothetical protein
MKTKFNVGDIISPISPSLYHKQTGGGHLLIMGIKEPGRFNHFIYTVFNLTAGTQYSVGAHIIDPIFSLAA